MRRPVLIVSVVLLAASACAKGVPKSADVARGSPSITWIIMHGDSDNPNREFACQSAPPSDCVLRASTQQEPVFSQVYLYYHGAGAETAYSGSVQIGFFRGAVAGGNRTDVTVKKNESIINQSTTGIVTDRPGTYALTIAFEATANGTKLPIREEVSVAVR